MNRLQGFTLLEVLIAIAILSVMSVMSYSGFEQVSLARERMEQQAETLSRLQMTYSVIKKDLEQVVNRRVRGSQGNVKPALLSPPNADLQVALVANNRTSLQNSSTGSRLQYVEYQLEGKVLRRVQYEVLDQAFNSVGEVTSLLNDIESMEMQFYHGGILEPFWPKANAGPFMDLPTAIEMTFTLSDGKDYRWWFLLPGKLG